MNHDELCSVYSQVKHLRKKKKRQNSNSEKIFMRTAFQKHMTLSFDIRTPAAINDELCLDIRYSDRPQTSSNTKIAETL